MVSNFCFDITKPNKLTFFVNNDVLFEVTTFRAVENRRLELKNVWRVLKTNFMPKFQLLDIYLL